MQIWGILTLPWRLRAACAQAVPSHLSPHPAHFRNSLCYFAHTCASHNSLVLIYRGKPCRSPMELPELLHSALCCCTRQGQAAKLATPGLPPDPSGTWCYWCCALLHVTAWPSCFHQQGEPCSDLELPDTWQSTLLGAKAATELGVKSQFKLSANHWPMPPLSCRVATHKKGPNVSCPVLSLLSVTDGKTQHSGFTVIL